MSEYSVCGFCIWLLQLTWHGLLFKAADKVDTGPLGRDRRKPRGQVRMPRERSQDHAPGQHTKVSGDMRWTVTRVGAEKQATKWDTGDRHEAGTAGCHRVLRPQAPVLHHVLRCWVSNLTSDNIVGFNFGMDEFLPIPSYNPLSEGLVRLCL